VCHECDEAGVCVTSVMMCVCVMSVMMCACHECDGGVCVS